MKKKAASGVTAAATKPHVDAVTSRAEAAGTQAAAAKRTNSSHPPTNVMVVEAIRALKERRGSSLAAIKKYIGGVYLVEVKRIAVYITRYINKAVETGALVRTKGKGASGSFKLGTAAIPAPRPAAAAKNDAKKRPADGAKAKAAAAATTVEATKSTGRTKAAAEGAAVRAKNAGPAERATKPRSTTRGVAPQESVEQPKKRQRVAEKKSIKNLTKTKVTESKKISAKKSPAPAKQKTLSSNAKQKPVAKKLPAKK